MKRRKIRIPKDRVSHAKRFIYYHAKAICCKWYQDCKYVGMILIEDAVKEKTHHLWGAKIRKIVPASNYESYYVKVE